MMRMIRWTIFAAPLLAVLAVGGAFAYRYSQLLHDDAPPEWYIRAEAAPELPAIADPMERALAERGRYLVDIGACDGCHHTPGGKYMAGGGKYVLADQTTVVASNLTPDPATGLGAVPEEDVLRALRTGITRDGRGMFHRAMPWIAYSQFTEEDRRAVVAYLRHLPPVAHRVPAPLDSAGFIGTGTAEEIYFGEDYGSRP